MKYFLAALLLVALLAVIALKRKGRSVSDGDAELPYFLGDTLFSPAERSFLGVLEQAVGNDFRVFGKVRVADIVHVSKGIPKPTWQRAFNRISAKHFDFVLCRPSDLKPICAIELNDQSHERDHRKGRDKFLEAVCAAAKLPLIFIPAQRTYTLSEVSQAIAGVTARSDELAVALAFANASQLAAPDTESEIASGEAAEPLCPRCSSPMVRRVAKSGENAGKAFFGCSKFPACRGVVHL